MRPGQLDDGAGVPSLATVQRLAEHTGDSIVRLAEIVIPGIVEITGNHHARLFSPVTKLFSDLAVGAVEFWGELTHGVEVATQLVLELNTKIAEVVDWIAGAVERFTEQLRAHLGQALRAVQDAWWPLIEQALRTNPVFLLHPREVQENMLVTARMVFDAQFELARALIDAQLVAIHDLAVWTREAVDAAVAAGVVNPDDLHRTVRSRALTSTPWSAPRVPIRFVVGVPPFTITIDLGSVELPVPHLKGAVMTTFDTVGAPLWQQLGGLGGQLLDLNQRRAAAQAATQADFPTGQELDRIWVHNQPDVLMDPEVPGAVVSGSVLTARVLANATYLEPVWGLQPRVTVFVDGVVRPVDPALWDTSPTDSIIYRARIVATSPTSVVPVPEAARRSGYAHASALLHRALFPDEPSEPLTAVQALDRPADVIELAPGPHSLSVFVADPVNGDGQTQVTFLLIPEPPA